MSPKDKNIRASKVAKELNIGLATIKDFFEENGINSNINPNSNISSENYELLIKEFQADKTKKEEYEKAAEKSKIESSKIKKEITKKNAKEKIIKAHSKDIKIKNTNKKINIFTPPKTKKPPQKIDKKDDSKTTSPVEEITANKNIKEIKLNIKEGKIDIKPKTKNKYKHPPIKQNKKPIPNKQDDKAKEEEIQKQIKETLQKLTKTEKSKSVKFRKEKRESIREHSQKLQQEAEKEMNKIKVTEFVTVNDLSNMMNVPVNKLISSCFTLGLIVTMNQRLDKETIELIIEEFGFVAEFVSINNQMDTIQIDTDESKLEHRPPIITVMGHVDHGKTSLLDYIRNSKVTSQEAGGITQHIGAYLINTKENKKITFLDTPGHEAFTAMRARGTQVTDIVIIIIAADEDVMPQTREAISHAKSANVPIIFAFSKIDKPNANVDKVKESLSKEDILVEDWGGKYQSQEISVKSGKGIDELLDKILLEAEILELKANKDTLASGTIIESKLKKGIGYVANVIVQNGTLKIGDFVLAGANSGKIKAMFDDVGNKIKIASPSTPITILGIDGITDVGDKFNVLTNEKDAKLITAQRKQLQREQSLRAQKILTLDEITRRMAIGDLKKLNLIIKGDVSGSLEALADSFEKLSTENIEIKIVHKGIGEVTESDVLLASASKSIIIAFNVRASLNARRLAEKEKIDIKIYSIIYDAVEEIKKSMEGLVSKKKKEVIVSSAKVKEVFKLSKIGVIAGCTIQDGDMTKGAKINVIRDGIVIYKSEISSIRSFKKDVNIIKKGNDCGLGIKNFQDIKVGDILEAYKIEE